MNYLLRQLYAEFSNFAQYLMGPDTTSDKWNKFKEFHMEMGIDYDMLIHAEYDKVVTDDVIKQLVKETSKKL